MSCVGTASVATRCTSGHALISLVAAVPLLALGVLPERALALLLVSVWVLGRVVSPRVALAASVPWWHALQLL
jgi:hypothetical protein